MFGNIQEKHYFSKRIWQKREIKRERLTYGEIK